MNKYPHFFEAFDICNHVTEVLKQPETMRRFIIYK